MALKKNVKRKIEIVKRALKPVSPHVQSVMDKINKLYGENTVVIASRAIGLAYHRGSTGSFGLDIGTGGGFCYGRIHMVIGKESASKTSLCLALIAEAQRKHPDCYCAFLDAEHTFDPKLAQMLGVDLSRVILINPDSLEQGGDVTQIMIQEGLLRVFVLDSWAALMPTAEYEDEMSKASSGRGALGKNKFMRKIVASLKGDLMSDDPKCMVVIINHINMNIGVTWGSPETDTGGMGKNYFSSIRVKVTRIGTIEEEDNGIKYKIGIPVEWHVIKNKTDTPYMQGRYDFYFAPGKKGKKIGIDNIGEVMEYSKKHKIIPDKAQRRSFITDYYKNKPKWNALCEEIRKKENAYKIASASDEAESERRTRKARGKASC